MKKLMALALCLPLVLGGCVSFRGPSQQEQDSLRTDTRKELCYFDRPYFSKDIFYKERTA